MSSDRVSHSNGDKSHAFGSKSAPWPMRQIFEDLEIVCARLVSQKILLYSYFNSARYPINL